MIKTRGRTSDGTPVVTLGLSRMNLNRLMLGEPIVLNLSELGLDPTHVVIVGGDSERAIMQKLEDDGAVPKGTVAQMPFDAEGNPPTA